MLPEQKHAIVWSETLFMKFLYKVWGTLGTSLEKQTVEVKPSKRK